MADFDSDFWHWYIAILTVLSILACIWLLRWMTSGFQKTDEVETTGHVWDEDLTELNNPLPRWWLGLFYITIAFGGFYLLLYPGLGKFGQRRLRGRASKPSPPTRVAAKRSGARAPGAKRPRGRVGAPRTRAACPARWPSPWSRSGPC